VHLGLAAQLGRVAQTGPGNASRDARLPTALEVHRGALAADRRADAGLAEVDSNAWKKLDGFADPESHGASLEYCRDYNQKVLRRKKTRRRDSEMIFQNLEFIFQKN
jgi:hypothetical protein